MMKLRINPIVAVDLKNIKEYIAKDNKGIAEDVILMELYCLMRYTEDKGIYGKM